MNRNPATESNWGGFGENETSRIPLCAVPASYMPGLRPSRGSLPLGYVCAWSAACGRASESASVAASARIGSRGKREGEEGRRRSASVGQVRQHLLHHADLGGLDGLNVVGKHRY